MGNNIVKNADLCNLIQHRSDFNSGIIHLILLWEKPEFYKNAIVPSSNKEQQQKNQTPKK